MLPNMSLGDIPGNPKMMPPPHPTPIGSPWVPMGPHGSPWIPMGPHGSPWVPMGSPWGPHGSPWVPMGSPWVPMGTHGTHGYPWVPMGPHGSPWVPMRSHGFPWVPMGPHGSHGAPVGQKNSFVHFQTSPNRLLSGSRNSFRRNSRGSMRNRCPVIFQPSVYSKTVFFIDFCILGVSLK